jgi:hypothetical protein
MMFDQAIYSGCKSKPRFDDWGISRGRKMEERTARLTLLIDPRKKAIFEALCAKEDVTPSQKVRQFIREYIEQKLGPEWLEDAAPPGGKKQAQQIAHLITLFIR